MPPLLPLFDPGFFIGSPLYFAIESVAWPTWQLSNNGQLQTSAVCHANTQANAFHYQLAKIVCVVDNLALSAKGTAVDEAAIYRAFGKAIAERRVALDHTQERVAKQVGLSRASLANIERGKQRVFLHQILALADALELNSAHEIVPERAISVRANHKKMNVTLSGAKDLSRDQKSMVNSIVSAFTASVDRDLK